MEHVDMARPCQLLSVFETSVWQKCFTLADHGHIHDVHEARHF